MRLWHYKLIPVLPDKMLVAQWRECIAIKRQWEKGTLKHRLVSYVMNYDKATLYDYFLKVAIEMNKRNINRNSKYIIEMNDFCNDECATNYYKEHNDRYLTQCYYNLEEKYDRGIVSFNEFQKIQEIMKDLD